MQGMGNVAKKAKLKELFGQQAATGMAALLDAFDTGKLQNRLNEIKTQSTGAAKNMADTMNDTLHGALGRMRSAFESIRIIIGDTLQNALRKLVEWITKLVTKIDAFMQAHPTLTKMIVALATAIMGVVSALLVVSGTMIAIKALMPIFSALRVKAIGAFLGITRVSGLAWTSLGKVIVRASYLAALAGLIYYAWQKNLFGVRNILQVFSAALKIVFAANSDGIAEIDAAIADQLKAAGLWDYAVSLGRIFWRIRQFFEGFVEGIRIGFVRVGNFFSRIGDFFAPLLSRLTDYTDALGLLKPIADSLSNVWRDWGKLIGEFVPYIIAAVVAFQGFHIVQGILGGVMGSVRALFALFATNPVTAALMLIGLVLMTLYFQFEGFRNFVNGIFENIVEVIGGVCNYILGFFQTIIGLITLDWGKMCEGMANMFKGFAKIVESVCNFVKNLIKGIGDGLRWIGLNVVIYI